MHIYFIFCLFLFQWPFLPSCLQFRFLFFCTILDNRLQKMNYWCIQAWHIPFTPVHSLHDMKSPQFSIYYLPVDGNQWYVHAEQWTAILTSTYISSKCIWFQAKCSLVRHMLCFASFPLIPNSLWNYQSLFFLCCWFWVDVVCIYPASRAREECGSASMNHYNQWSQVNTLVVLLILVVWEY